METVATLEGQKPSLHSVNIPVSEELPRRLDSVLVISVFFFPLQFQEHIRRMWFSGLKTGSHYNCK